MRGFKQVICVGLAICLLASVRGTVASAQNEGSFCDVARIGVAYNQTAIIDLPVIDTRVVDITYWPEQRAVWFISVPPEMADQDPSDDDLPHEIYLRHHVFDLVTGAVTEIEYPYADIVTPELTDKLGLTDDVLGENSYLHSLMVSPARDKVIFFRYDDLADLPCCGDNYAPYAVWSANLDGSDPHYLELTRQPTYLNDITWHPGRVVLTFNDMFGGGQTPLELCLDASCVHWFRLEPEFEGQMFSTGSGSISPDGRLVVLTTGLVTAWVYVQDRETGEQWRIPLETEFPRLRPFWDANSRAFYLLTNWRVVRYDLDAAPYDAVADVSSWMWIENFYAQDWLFLPEYGMVIVVDGSVLSVQCYGIFDPPPV